MPTITYIEHDGTEHPVDVPVGKSVMQGAVEKTYPVLTPIAGGNAPARLATSMSTPRG